MGAFVCFYVSLVYIYSALSQVINESTETITYTNTTTTVSCPGQLTFILPDWSGPPVTSTGALTIYTIDGKEIVNSAKPRVSYAADKRSLLITDTELGDAGIYMCYKQQYAFNGKNVVRVRMLPNEPEITTSGTEDNSGVWAIVGQALRVTCISRGGYPSPTVAWYKGSINSHVLAHTSTGTQVGDTYTVTLSYTFTPMRQDDRHQLVCRSYYPTPEDSQGSLEKRLMLYFFIKPSEPFVTQSSSVVAGSDFFVECRTNGSRPAANMSWTYQGHTYTPAVIVTKDPSSQTFTTVSVLQRPATAADNGQIVQCTVTHKTLTAGLMGFIKLNVLYPPMVIVDMTNVTVTNTSTTMTCLPSGNPDKYTLSEWIHSWEGHVVARLPNTPVLTLTGLSYEYSGVYICRATNGIGGYQQGSGTLLVKSFPIVLQPQTSEFEVVVAIGVTAPIYVTFYSNTDHVSVRCNKRFDDRKIDTVRLENAEVSLPVFDDVIKTKGTKAVISIAVTSEEDFGEYQIIIVNEIGHVEVVVNVTDGSPPGVPEEVDALVLSFNSMNVSWSAGYHGGLDQTFVVQISTDQLSWRDITVFGRQAASGSRMFHVIDRLSADTLYYVRIYAQNAKGRSNFSPVKQLTTDIKPECESTSTDGHTSPSALIGTAVGGIVGGFVLAVILYQFITRLIGRRFGKYKDSIQSSIEGKRNLQVDLSVQGSGAIVEGPANTYETLRGEEQSAHTYSDIKTTTQESYSMPSDREEYTNLSLK